MFEFAGIPEAEAGATGLNHVTVIPLGSDKGLCGAINSGVAKQVRAVTTEEEGKGATVSILCGGNKSYGALKRLLGDRYNCFLL